MKSIILICCIILSCSLFGKETKAKSPAVEKKVENPVVEMKTNYGTLQIELFQKEAPLSVKNFLRYAKEGFYNGTIFHRVIDNFMIQGGGFTKEMKQKDTHAPIKNEATNKISNAVGTVAMARTSQVDSATSQFFINVKDNEFLNHRAPVPRGYGYAVFGKVIKGMTVVNKIKAVKTTTKNGYRDVPAKEVVIESVKQL